MFRFQVVLLLFAGLAAIVAGSAALAAQPYPSKPIRLVLNVGTGGVGDITNRIFATHMSRSLGLEQAKIERQ